MLVNNCLEFILESAKHIVALFGIVNTLAAASACRTFLAAAEGGVSAARVNWSISGD